MTLTEAILTGIEFKRPNWSYSLIVSENKLIQVRTNETEVQFCGATTSEKVLDLTVSEFNTFTLEDLLVDDYFIVHTVLTAQDLDIKNDT